MPDPERGLTLRSVLIGLAVVGVADGTVAVFERRQYQMFLEFRPAWSLRHSSQTGMRNQAKEAFHVSQAERYSISDR